MPPDPSRRTLLSGLAGVFIGFGGCLDGTFQTPSTDEPSATTRATDSRTEGDGPRLGTVWVTDSVAHVANVDSLVVTGAPDGHQFVFASYRDDSDIHPHRFGLRVAGEQYAPSRPKGSYVTFDTIAMTSDRVSSEEAVTGFVVPVRDTVEQATLTYDGTPVTDLDQSMRQRLTGDPAFEVRSFSLPERVQPTETLVADLTVENVGSRDGTFRATAPHFSVGPTLIEHGVPVGESVQFTTAITWGASRTPMQRSAGEKLTVELSWPGGTRTATVFVEPATATDG